MGLYGSPDLSRREETPKKVKKPVYKRWWFWIIIAILVLGTIGSNIEENTQQVANQAQVNSNQKPTEDEKIIDEISNIEKIEEKFYGLGELAETSKVKAIINSIEKAKGNDFNKPADGKEFVLLNITIENVSNSDIAISSILSFNAYVDDVSVNESFSAQISKEGINTVDGTVAPGKKIIGTLAYELNKEWKQLEIHFTADLWEGTVIKWLIENE